MTSFWDTEIIGGGGPAGLSAALVLGRCCRNVLLCDAGAVFGINRSPTREEFERQASGVQRAEHPPLKDEDTARRRPQK